MMAGARSSEAGRDRLLELGDWAQLKQPLVTCPDSGAGSELAAHLPSKVIDSWTAGFHEKEKLGSYELPDCGKPN